MKNDETSRRTAALRAQLASDSHLDPVGELVPYVDGILKGDAKRSAEAHLANCEVCRREVADLRQFARPRRRVLRRAIAAIAAAAAVVIAVTVMRRPEPPPRVVPPTRQAFAVELRDSGRVIGIDREGVLHGLGVDPETARRAAALLANPDLAVPAALSSLAGSPRNLRGETASAPAIEVVSPVGIAVLDTRPELIWSAHSRAPYQITITDRKAMEIHGETTNERWSSPSSLERGKTYAWQVSTTINGTRVVAPSPPALFRVVDQETADAIRTANSRLVAGMLAYEQGAIVDARREFALLAGANPSSPIPAKLIRSCDRAMSRGE